MVYQKDSTNTPGNSVPRSDVASGNPLHGKFVDSGYGSFSQTLSLSDFTDGGSTTGTVVLTSQIPLGSVYQQTMVTDITGFIGDTTAVLTVGDGTDVDRYNTSTVNVFVTDTSVSAGAPSGTTYHDAAASVTLTITSGADFTSVTEGKLTVHMVYFKPE